MSVHSSQQSLKITLQPNGGQLFVLLVVRNAFNGDGHRTVIELDILAAFHVHIEIVVGLGRDLYGGGMTVGKNMSIQ